MIAGCAASREACVTCAGVAQSVEQLIRNEKVEGSIPFSGTNKINNLASDALRGFVVFGSRTD